MSNKLLPNFQFPIPYSLFPFCLHLALGVRLPQHAAAPAVDDNNARTAHDTDDVPRVDFVGLATLREARRHGNSSFQHNRARSRNAWWCELLLICSRSIPEILERIQAGEQRRNALCPLPNLHEEIFPLLVREPFIVTDFQQRQIFIE